MMPGESHSKSAGICPNCTVLHQNLKEYVAALLILERKIIDTDHLLTEYQEKCDDGDLPSLRMFHPVKCPLMELEPESYRRILEQGELQKSQRETSKLHQELDELLLKMVPLEKRNEECEAMRSELEEKNKSLKKYQETSEELDRMKEDCTKLLASKKNLENELKTFEDSGIKKDCKITQLKKEKIRLEENLRTTQKSLEELEIRLQKEFMNVATQTDFPEEPKIDKAKVKQLFEELWMCIEPKASEATSDLNLFGLPCESSDYRIDHLKRCSVLVQGTKELCGKTNNGNTRKRKRPSGELMYGNNLIEKKTSPSSSLNGNHEEDIKEILDCFKPLPPLLSPLIFNSPREALFGDLSDSGDEKLNDDCQATEISMKETTDVSMLLAPTGNDVLDSSTLCDTKICENSRVKKMDISQSEIQICELEKKMEHADEAIMYNSNESVLGGLSGLSPGSTVKKTVPSIMSTEQSIPEHTGSVKNEGSNAEDMVVEESPQNEKEIFVEVNCEKALQILQNKHTGDQKVSCASLYSESILETQSSILTVNCDNLGNNKDVDVHSKTPSSYVNLIQGGLLRPEDSNETEYQNPPSTLNYLNNDDTKSENTASKPSSEVNPADGPEESICISDDNPQINANVLTSADGTLASKSPHCPNDESSDPEDLIPDALLSETCTGPDVNLNPPSKHVTASEVFTGAVSCTDGIKPLEIIQNGTLSEVSNHITETEFTRKEYEKPNKMDMNACKMQDLTKTIKMPALNFQTSPSKTSSVDTDNPISRIPFITDRKPLVDEVSTPAEIPADVDKLQASSSNDPEKCRESSDEQESFGLQRKVKTIYQRAGNQASAESENDLIKSEQGSLGTHEDSEKNPGTSHELQEDPSEMSQTSLDSSLMELDSSTNGTQVVVADSVPEEETFTKLCGNQVLDGLEETKDNCKEYKIYQNQSQKITDQGYSLSPKFSSKLKEGPCSPQTDERIDENAASKITQEEVAGKSEDVNNCSLSNSADIPTDYTQPESFINPEIFSQEQQCSANGQERFLNLKNVESEKLTDPPLLAASDTAPPGRSQKSLRKVRFEMGPPLPPLLNPLTVTPPRLGTQDLKTVPCKLSIPSKGQTPIQETSMAPLALQHTDGSVVSSPCLSISSADDAKRRRVISSPLQFCTSTPKHAVPVPGRLPSSASNLSSSSPGAPQENSVRILDTMYPELSARARTLNILRRTVNLSSGAPDTGVAAQDSVSPISRFKAVNSSRVLTKAGRPDEHEIGFNQSIENSTPSRDGSSALIGQSGKKTGVNVLLPKKQDSDSPVCAMLHGSLSNRNEVSRGESSGTRKDGQVGNATTCIQNTIINALKKIETSCSDLLPVIKRHASISKMPVLADEEKEVIHEFCVENKHLTDDLLSAILVKMKTEKNTLCGVYMQALCRVYTGICRQREDWERVHLFAYSILKEDFPDSAKLILFMVTTWYNVLSHTGVLCKAMHAILRLKAQEEVLHCLSACLNWETNPPCDSEKIIKSTLMALRMGVNMKFLNHDRHGDDLNPAAWTYIFTLDLLCTQRQWKWTHDNIICKELWPIMNSWVTQGRSQQTPITDISVAATLRLIGRLGQLGIKEKSFASVKNVAKVINTFVIHGKGEGVPWPVQLAAVYTIYDLSPSDPKEALDALAAWRGETSEAVPPAVTSCITQIGSVCRYIKS